jgi:Domain of unknown function (DUF4184)
MEDVPFTLSHAAAALPFRRHLIISALVVGTLAPDFEYFLRLSPEDRFGHTVVGIFTFTLPLALLVLWIFHALIKVPVIALLPEAIQRRLAAHHHGFSFIPARRFALIVVSLVLGIATHLLWDSFTHPTTWLYYHWSFLRQPVHLPILGWVGHYKLLQHLSTVFGLTVLLLWFARWYESTSYLPERSCSAFSPGRKIAIISIITIIASLGAVARIVAMVSVSERAVSLQSVVGKGVVTLIALLWWELVIYGLLFRKLKRSLRGQPLDKTLQETSTISDL